MYFSLIAKLKTQLSPKINVTAKSRELDNIKIKMSLEVNKQPEPGGLGIRRALLTLHRPFLTTTTLHPYGSRRGNSAVPPAPLLMKLMTIHASRNLGHLSDYGCSFLMLQAVYFNVATKMCQEDRRAHPLANYF